MRINYWVDWVAVRVMIFASAFICVRFYVRNLLLSIFISVIATALISVGTFFAFKSKKHKRALTAEQRKKQQFYLQQLTYSSANSNLTFFHNMLCASNKVDLLSPYLLLNESTLIYIKISPERFNAVELLALIHRATELNVAKLCVLTNSTDKDIPATIALFSQFSIKICTGDFIFSLMQAHNCYPPVVVKPKKNRASFLLPVIFSKDKFKKYLSASVFLILGSIFLPYSVYYSISSALLIVASIISYKQPFAPAPPSAVW